MLIFAYISGAFLLIDEMKSSYIFHSGFLTYSLMSVDSINS